MRVRSLVPSAAVSLQCCSGRGCDTVAVEWKAETKAMNIRRLKVHLVAGRKVEVKS